MAYYITFYQRLNYKMEVFFLVNVNFPTFPKIYQNNNASFL